MRQSVTRLAPVLAIWGVSGAVLAFATRSVADWFVMTDELLYERVGFSSARSGSPLPSLHGQRIPFANDLYPMFLSLIAGDDLVPDFLRRAHTWNAVLMTSAAIPVFLIARRSLESTGAAYAVSLLSVLLPWLVLSSFLLTDAVAYPSFLWAVFLVQRAVERPGPGADVLAIAGIALAVASRTQFVLLVPVAILGAVVHDRRPRLSFERHRVLAIVTAACLLPVVVLSAAGRAHVLLGFYGATTQGDLLSTQLPQAFAEHAAALALGLGILPFVLGCAWLSARALRGNASAVIYLSATVLLIAEVAMFDLRFGEGLPHDRYLYYVAPLVLIGFLGSLRERSTPRWPLLAPIAIVVVGFATSPIPVFDKLNPDAVTAIFNNYLVTSGNGIHGARIILIASTILLVIVFVFGRIVLGRRVVAVALVAAAVVAMTAETSYAFDRLFRVNGTAGRPITLRQGIVFDWVDRIVGTNADVTIVPSAQIRSDYWSTAAYWWDLEFWNRSVIRDAYIDNEFAEIQSTFPRTALSFDPVTGRASTSPTQYVVESDSDPRFHIRGRVVTLMRSNYLIDAGSAWQADWITLGLDDDGFTRPRSTARLRVFATTDQRGPELRYVTLLLQSVNVRQGARFDSNAGHWSTLVKAGSDANLGASVCVPAHGFADILIHPRETTTVWGDLGTPAGINNTRVRGILVARIALADETGPACTP